MRRTRPIIAGNWKMNQTRESITAFFQFLKGQSLPHAERWIAPQAMHLSLCQQLAPSDVKIGAQNCSWENSGALTGELSPAGLADLGLHFTIIGHSERRSLFHESDATIERKLTRALDAGLNVILCVGETLNEREAGETEQILAIQVQSALANVAPQQMERLLIAYEPVWAIGTGKSATPDMAQTAHAFIRSLLSDRAAQSADLPILYGGSVKPDNIQELLRCPDIDGALVGGASLKAADYHALCSAK